MNGEFSKVMNGEFSKWPQLIHNASTIEMDQPFSPTITEKSIERTTGSLDQVAGKLCELIIGNETFRQIITDAVFLAFQQNLNNLEKRLKILKKKILFFVDSLKVKSNTGGAISYWFTELQPLKMKTQMRSLRKFLTINLESKSVMSI